MRHEGERTPPPLAGKGPDGEGSRQPLPLSWRFPQWAAVLWVSLRVAAFYGVMYTTLSMRWFCEPWWGYLPPTFVALTFLRTCGLYACLFLIPVFALERTVGRLHLGRPQWLTHAVIVFVLVWSGLNVAWNLDQVSEVPLWDSYRLHHAVWLAVLTLPAGLIAGPLLAALCHPKLSKELETILRWPARAVTLLILGLVMLPLGGPITMTGVPTAPTYVIGLDGASWKVLLPLLRDQQLPAFARILRESAYGTLLTYGKPYSPPVWTTIATGKKPQKHGIYSHVIHEPGQLKPVLVGSKNRRAAALWDIASTLERKVLVVNYYVAHPPERVNGINVTSPGPGGRFEVWPTELQPLLQGVNKTRGRDDISSDASTLALADLEAVQSLFSMFKPRGPFDLTILYSHSPDAIQHRNWHYQEPAYFRHSTSWQMLGRSLERPLAENPIASHWKAVDRFLAAVLETAPDATVVIVSDHGFRPLPYPYTRVRLNDILAALGLLRYGEKESIDFTSTIAYSSGSDSSFPKLCVNVNLAAREPKGIVPLKEADGVKQHVARQLRGVLFEDNASPVFPRVLVNNGGKFRGQYAACDLLVGLNAQNRRPSPRKVKAGNSINPQSKYVDIVPNITGTHDVYGIIAIRSSGISPGPFLFRGSLGTAISTGLAFLNGRVQVLDPVMALARRIGLLPYASTLDITPTVLELMGLPRATDMDGRSIIKSGIHRKEVASYDYARDQTTKDSATMRGSDPENAAMDDAVRERLRNLGYLQ